jgi:hypothetical protein
MLVTGICRQHAIDDAASTVFPLQATTLDASVSEPETLFRLPPLMRKLDKKLVNNSPLR